MNLTNQKKIELQRWRACRMRPPWQALSVRVGRHLFEAKLRYEDVAAKTNVPWFVIAVVHERESSQSWSGSLAQGDPWDKVSTHVPKGRGPFSSWEDAAADALVHCAPYAAAWKDWSIGGTLLLLQEYNGMGYAKMGQPSPYLWSGTNQYYTGKYIGDGHYDAAAIDKQLGCVPMLLALAKLDSTIAFAA